DELAGGVLAVPARGEDADRVVAALEALGPRHGEIEVVTGAPGNPLRDEGAQGELAGQAEIGEAVVDAELVVERIRGLGGLVGDELRGEAAGVEASDLENAVAGEAMHGHGTAVAGGVAPETDLAGIERARAERKQDRVAAADLG